MSVANNGGWFMEDNEQEYLGFIQYVGRSVDSGYLDAKKSAQALLGLDEALRYFVEAQDPELAGEEYEIPVRIQKGSWQALIPQDIGVWLAAALRAAFTAYAVTAAQQMAKNDFREAGFRHVFAKALEAIQWAIRIGKHVGTLAKRRFESVRWRNGNSEVGILNAAGEVLFVPVEFLRFYERMPVSVLVKITSVVTDERQLEVVLRRNERDEVETVSSEDKAIFCPENAAILFPELEHGAPFDSEGLVTRGNENANSLGFLYEGHILTCYPKEGNIVRFKSALFLTSRMKGSITRLDKFGEPREARPKIIFTDVTPVEEERVSANNQQSLFFDDET